MTDFKARIASQTIAEIKPTNDRYSETENRSCQATQDTAPPPQQRADDRADSQARAAQQSEQECYSERAG